MWLVNDPEYQRALTREVVRIRTLEIIAVGWRVAAFAVVVSIIWSLQ